jgi:hypothetical protein
VNVFTEADFLPADTTDIPLGASAAQLSTNDEPQPGCSSIRDGSGTAGTLPAMRGTPATTAGTSSFPNLYPEDIWPLSKASQEQMRVSRKREKTAL